MCKKKVYLAGPLFSVAERVHNIRLATRLRIMGVDVYLPQETDEKFRIKDGSVDLNKVQGVNWEYLVEQDRIVVAWLDWPDPDSGTAVEVGAKLMQLYQSKKYILEIGLPLIGYVTDFCISRDRLNLMFKDVPVIWCKSDYIKATRDIDVFYDKLASAIYTWISPLSLNEGRLLDWDISKFNFIEASD